MKDHVPKTSNGIAETDADRVETPLKVESDSSPTEETPSTVSPIAKLFGVEQEQTIRCTKCGSENSKTSPVLLSSLTLQDLEGTAQPNHIGFEDFSFFSVLQHFSMIISLAGEQSFEHVLERSFDVENVTPAWCEACQKYQATQQRRRCLSLPPVLALSCANDTYKGFRFWSDQLQVSHHIHTISIL